MDTDTPDDQGTGLNVTGTGLVDGFSYYFGRTFKESPRWADGVDEDEEEMLETHNGVLEETDGAIPLACSGATNVDASTTFDKLSCPSAMSPRANPKTMSS